MSEFICKECGAQIDSKMKSCPNCGCPIDIQITAGPEKEEISRGSVGNNRPKFGVFAYLPLCIGIIIFICGMVVCQQHTEIKTHDAGKYSVSSLEFGADFYTEIYKAADTSVDELNEINQGIELLSISIGDGINEIYKMTGYLIMAIGGGTIAISLFKFNK